MDGVYDQVRIALHSVWRRRWLALAVAWGLCLFGWLIVALIPNRYESTAKVFAQVQSILPDKLGITATERQSDLLRVKQTLTSTETLQKVVRRTDLSQLVASERDLAVQVEALRDNIKIVAQPDNIFEISAGSGVAGFTNAQNAKIASAVVQNLLDLFGEGRLAGDTAETGQTLAFLDAELKRREGALQEAEQRRVEFETKFMGMLPGEGSIAQRMATARAELANIDQQLIGAQGSLAAIRGQLAGTAPSVAGPGGYAGGPATAQIGALEAQLSSAQARGWTDRHPDVVTTRAEIARLRPQAAREGGARGAGGATNPLYVSLRSMTAEKEAQVSAAQIRKSQLEAAMAQLSSNQAEAPGVVAEQARLNRDYEVLKRQYDKLLEDREQVRLRADAQSNTDAIRFKIIDPPSNPSSPALPGRPLLLTGVLLLGLGAGLAAAFAKSHLQRTFPTQARLAALTGLPVLGAVSEVLTPEHQLKRRQALKYFAGAGGALAGAYLVLMAVEFWQLSAVA